MFEKGIARKLRKARDEGLEFKILELEHHLFHVDLVIDKFHHCNFKLTKNAKTAKEAAEKIRSGE